MSSPSFEDELIGRPRIARLLGVSVWTVAMYQAQGRFQTTAIDGRLFARVSDVLRFREEREASKRDRARRRA